jgi:DNA-binding NtrC family response regulator
MPPEFTRSPTILVTEDDELIRDMASAILRGAGYRTILAENGDFALRLLSDTMPIEVLFTDIVMPGELDGFRLAEMAKRVRPALKILYTSGFSALQRHSHLALHGSLMPKPYGAGQLLGEVKSLLAGRRMGGEARSPRLS